MAATVISRNTWTDDDGSGTTGTIIGNSRLQADVYDKVDALFSGVSPFEFGGAVTVDGVLTSTGALLTTPTVTSPLLIGYREVVIGVSPIAGVVTLNLSLGTHFFIALNANATLSIINPPANVVAFTMVVSTDGVARTITWPVSVLPAYQTFPTITPTGRYDIFDLQGANYGGGQLYWMSIRGQNF